MKHTSIGLMTLLFVVGIVCAQELTDLNSIQRLADQGQWEEAFQQLNRRIENRPDDVQARFLKGLLQMQRGNTFVARETFAELTRLYPQLPQAYNNLAAVYARQGEYELAREALLQAVASMPDYPAARENLGDLYTKLAADAYREALQLDPSDEESRAKLRMLEQMFAEGG